MCNNDANCEQERIVKYEIESIMFHFARMEQNDVINFYLS